MRLLFIGDIVGAPGVAFVRQAVPVLIAHEGLDVVIANAENAAGGSGLTASLYRKLREGGVDLMTLGDHIYKKAEIIPTLEKEERLCKPANFPADAPGHPFARCLARDGTEVVVVSLLGRTFMRPVDCPFQAADRVLGQLGTSASCDEGAPTCGTAAGTSASCDKGARPAAGSSASCDKGARPAAGSSASCDKGARPAAGSSAGRRVVVVDVHAEATADKYLLGHHLKGRVSAVLGTHTHVQTADEQVLPGGTAFISDVGMTGPYDSVLGRRIDRVLPTTITFVPSPFDVASGDPRLGGAIVDVDAATGRATSIRRVMLDEAGLARLTAGGG
jgi:calcineurin-like phosphoesterase